MTTDNASSNKTMIKALVKKLGGCNTMFGENRHIPCFAHILNLTVQAAFKSFTLQPSEDEVDDEEQSIMDATMQGTPFVEYSADIDVDDDSGDDEDDEYDVYDEADDEDDNDGDDEDMESEDDEDSEETVDDLATRTLSSTTNVRRHSVTLGTAVEKVRNVIRAIRKGHRLRKKYIKLCRKKGMPNTNKLQLDCPTRWSSTYTMLEGVLAKRTVLEIGASHFKMSKRDMKITKEEWELLQIFFTILKPFALATDAVSSSRRQTVSELLIIVKVCNFKLF